MTDRKAWRDQVQEQAIEPDLPIIDAHHHLWSVPPVPDRFEAYDSDELFADMRGSGHRIVGTVLVDSHSNYSSSGPENLRVVGETQHAESVAEAALHHGEHVAGACCAIISSANLLHGEAVGEVLDAHMGASPRFRGIRHMTAYDEMFGPIYGADSRGIMEQPEFRLGIKELGKRNLCFEAWLFQSQHNELVSLAREFAETTIIVDHMGGPLGIGRYADEKVESFQSWKRGLEGLAQCGNIYMKLGGLNQGFSGFVSEEQARPMTSSEICTQQGDHIRAAIDIFGPSRCMFESNFPADMIYTSYTVLWNSFKLMTGDLTKSDRSELFMNSALRAYRVAAPIGIQSGNL